MGITIAIQVSPDERPRKLTKIIRLGDGGFSVLMPYHRAARGFLSKVPVDYNVIGTTWSPYSEWVGFNAENRAKLAYHYDGFAQFSGEFQGTIISGRDPDSGEPRGLGLMTQPLNDPIQSGPSFIITAWGLEEFDELTDFEDSIIYRSEEMYFKGIHPSKVNAVTFEVFVFLPHYWSAVRRRDSEYILTLSFPNYWVSHAVLELKVLNDADQDLIIAGFMNKVHVEMDNVSGWTLGGPGNKDETGKGHVLQAYYPGTPKLRELFRSIDYKPKPPSESTEAL